MAPENLNTGVLAVELWAPEIQRNLREESVMLDCVNTKFQGMIQQKGDRVHFQYPSGVTVADYQGAVVYQDLQAEDFELVIDQEKYFGFKIGDIEKAQAQVEIRQPYIEEATQKIAEIKDKFILSKSADVPAGNIVPAVDNFTPQNAYKVFVDLSKVLRKSKALNAKRKGRDGKNGWAIINPDVEAILLQSEQFIHATSVGDKTIREGAIGRIAGLDIIVTNYNEAQAGATTILAGTTEAITYADQITKTESMRDPNSFADLFRGLYVYGGKTMLPDALSKCVVTIA